MPFFQPKFKLKWVEGQVKKDRYKQIFLDEMKKYEDEMSIVEDRTPEPDVASQKKDFYELESNTEESSRDFVEVEVAGVAKKIEWISLWDPIIFGGEDNFSLGSVVIVIEIWIYSHREIS